MYLYVAFFNDEALKREHYFLTGKLLESLKSNFSNYFELNDSDIKGCIGYIKNKKLSDNKCFVLETSNFIVNENDLSFDFRISKELNVTNRTINNALYKFAHKSGWIDKMTGYYPMMCIVNKLDFDLIRKGTPNIRKTSSKTAILENLRSNNNWHDICELYKPLEEAHNNVELWNNANDLYDLAYACSKIGEPQNGKEKDKKHLFEVKRYRELSIRFFNRCYELEPLNFRYASSIGYRYYLNAMELNKAKGRRDGKLNDEIDNAILWFDKAIELNPRSIKDNYRKGKIILDIKIDNYKYSSNNWTKETFDELDKIEAEGIKCIESLIDIYEGFGDEKYKKRYRKEYSKGLYCLGSYYIHRTNIHLIDYACNKLTGSNDLFGFSKYDLQCIAKSKELLEKCFKAESNIDLDDNLKASELLRFTEKWSNSPLDKLYKLGLVYQDMYFVKKVLNGDIDRIKEYKDKSYKFLNTAKNISYEMKKSKMGRRDTWFISEKIARHYIISEQYEDAIRIIEKARASYILNTYSIALLLLGGDQNIKKAETTLLKVSKDKYNKAKNISVALLCYTYSVQNKIEELNNILKSESKLVDGASKKYLKLLGIGCE